MAIVKAKYVKKGSSAKHRAKATIRYIQHRPDKAGSRTIRALYGRDGVMERGEAYRMIDEAERGLTFFRIIISPDPAKEDKDRDLNMRSIAENTMQALEERIQKTILWVASDHQDHTDHRHIHALALVPGRLTKYDFERLRRQATDTSLQQRRELDRAQLQRQLQREEGEWSRGY